TQALEIGIRPSIVDVNIPAVGPTQFAKRFDEERYVLWHVGGHEHADPAGTTLGACRERPCYRTTEQPDELAPPHMPPQSQVCTLPHCGRKCRVVHHNKFGGP